MSIEELAAKIIVEAGAVEKGRFKLSSGLITDIYIDARRILSLPTQFRKILFLLYSKFSSFLIDGIVGVATGGIPWATGLALISGLPLGYVRPEAKKHGLSRIIEGIVKPIEVVVVDDVATTGGSILRSISLLREAGFTVNYAIVIVDREAGAKERLKDAGVELLSLTRLSIIRKLLNDNLSKE